MSASNRILVTGGTGTVGSEVAAALRLLVTSPKIATRTPSESDAVRFDWRDPDTYVGALEDVGAMFLVAPSGEFEALSAMRPFLETALIAGVNRYVLLSAAAISRGGIMMGEVHAWLEPRAHLAVLRPSWFMQNFLEAQLSGIRERGEIVSATADGAVAFIDAADIGAVGARLLTDPSPVDGEWILTGPEALTYDAVATLIGRAARRHVVHRSMTVEAYAADLIAAGLSERYARALAAMDGEIARGAEDRVTDAVATIAHRPPTTFANFASANEAAWRA